MFLHCRSRAAVLVPILLTLASAGCDTQFRARVAGVSLAEPTFLLPVVRFLPQTVIPLPIAGFGCPIVQPFSASFDLVVDGHGSTDVVLVQVTFRFFDGSSFGQSPLIFTGSDLTGRFGQMTIPANTTRAFHFTPQFGCGVSRPHTLAADVILVDPGGTRHNMSLSAPIQ
jgi:hypothetical protein